MEVEGQSAMPELGPGRTCLPYEKRARVSNPGQQALSLCCSGLGFASGWTPAGIAELGWQSRDPMSLSEAQVCQGHLDRTGSALGSECCPMPALRSAFSLPHFPPDGPDPFWVTSRWHSREPGALRAHILLGNLPSSLASPGCLHWAFSDPPG